MIEKLKIISKKWEEDHPPNLSDNGIEDSEEEDDEEEEITNRNKTYVQQLDSISKLLKDKHNEDNLVDLVKTLGNDIASVRSAPTALFSFLKARVDAELLMQIKGDFYTEIILFSIVTPQTDATGGRRRHSDS